MKINHKEMPGNEFLKVLTHELRNPLAAILMTLELIKAEGMDPVRTPQLLEAVEDRARVISGVLDHLLDHSRVSSTVAVATLKSDPSSLKKIPAREKTVQAHGAIKVLIVDDNHTAADSLDQLLSLRGYEVIVAYSGAEALEIARTFIPQTAILDIAMPEMDGYELVGLLHKQIAECTYVALTGYGRADEKKKAKEAGFNFHLTKPAHLKDIEKILKKTPFEMKK